MNSNTETITLTEDLFLGKGAHKKCYQHPTDKNLCVKILFQTPDVDLEKELKYRKVLKQRNIKTTLLPEYLGIVKTNLGEGHIFERCCDYDGKTSLTIKQFIASKPATPEHIANVIQVILKFKELYFRERIVTSDMDPANFMVQKISKDEFTIKIIDNIGTPVMIPLAYYFDYFAAQRTKKYWKRFLEYLKRVFPDIFKPEIIKQIQ